MNIGIPLEIMTGEGRVALTPEACSEIIDAGHRVYVQHGAGLNSGYTDQDYLDQGAELVADAKALYDATRLIVKVKQPLAPDLSCLRKDHILFSYLHLAPDPELIQALCDIGLCAIPFESVSEPNGSLPLLAPMSQVAGRIAIIRGASLLFRNRGGRGVLLGGVNGSDTGRVVVLGAGVAGRNAVKVAAAIGSSVAVVDLDEHKLQALKQKYPGIETHISSPEIVEKLCLQADLVVGAVLLAGRRAPVVLKQSVIKQMYPGSVIVDISIDQGGCVEGIRATSSEELFYMHDDVIHSAVPNMPAAVARTASQSLSTAVLPYVLLLSGMTPEALRTGGAVNDPARGMAESLSRAVAINQGEVVDEVLQQEYQSWLARPGDTDSVA